MTATGPLVWIEQVPSMESNNAICYEFGTCSRDLVSSMHSLLSHADMRAQRPEKGGSLIIMPSTEKGAIFQLIGAFGETLITAILKRTMVCLGKKTLESFERGRP
jgi:hypothetical protein